MRRTLPFLILCACLSVEAVWEPDKLFATQAGVFSFADCLPQQTVSFEDLDPRDENNQPIADLGMQSGLKELFNSGLYTLLVRSDIHSIAAALAVIRKELNLAASSLAGQLPQTVKTVISAIALSTRQWDKILICLTGLFGSLLLRFFYTLTPNPYTLSYTRIAPVPLRC